MTNWCNTKIGFICDETNIKELARLYHSLNVVGEMINLRSYIPGVPWLGCVALAHGIDYSEIPCTGEIIEVGDYTDGGTSFIIYTVTEWNSATKLWDEVIKQYTGIRYVCVINNPGMELYINTDTDGICFPEKYIVYAHTGNISFRILPPDYFTDSITSREFFSKRYVFNDFDALQKFMAEITGVWFIDLFTMNWHLKEAMKIYDSAGDEIAKAYEYEPSYTTDSDEKTTDNYLAHNQAIEKNVGVSDIVKAVDYILLLSKFINADNEVWDEMDIILEPFNKIIEELRTEEKCPRCGGSLYKSDVSQYNYVCPDCEENF